jgi:hypothetical protein
VTPILNTGVQGAEEGTIFNEAALVGDLAVLGDGIVKVEAEELTVVASCSQSAAAAVLTTLAIMGPVSGGQEGV